MDAATPLAHLYFLGLSGVGYDWLWGRIGRSGAAVRAIVAARQTGVLPDGTALTGGFLPAVPAFDRWVLPAVIFYDNLLSAAAHGETSHRQLLVSLFATMQATSHCIMVLGWQHGQRPWWSSLEHVFWGVFNQAWGAATVYPMYCFGHVHRFLGKKELGDPVLGPSCPHDGLSLISTALLGSLMPAMLLYPAFAAGCSTPLRQSLIALYRLTPVCLSLFQPLVAFALSHTRGVANQGESALTVSKSTGTSARPTRGGTADRARAQRHTAVSLLISGGFAAASHLWAIWDAWRSPRSSLSRVFWPLSLAAGTGAPSDGPNILASTAHEFLQWDVIAIALALVPLAFLVSRGGESEHSSGAGAGGHEGEKRAQPALARPRARAHELWRRRLEGIWEWRPVQVASWAVACCVVSPGGLLAFSMARRVLTGLSQQG